jgi:hypothetical protein
LEDLVSVGLKELNISYDDFHAVWLEKFGGEQNIINAAKAGVELGLTTLIGVVRDVNSKISVKYVRELLQEEKLYGVVEFMEDFIAPVGRARNTISRSFIRILNKDLDGCKNIGTISVHPNGRVVACCGYSQIREISILKKISWKSVRLFASGGFYGYFGLFYIPDIGKAWIYSTRRENVILIRTERKNYILSPDDPEDFVEDVKRRII